MFFSHHRPEGFSDSDWPLRIESVGMTMPVAQPPENMHDAIGDTRNESFKKRKKQRENEKTEHNLKNEARLWSQSAGRFHKYPIFLI
jgi:hypothetical protein